MKRWLCLFLAFLLICPCLLLGASAAEPTEYIFEVMPSVSMLDDYEFSGLYDYFAFGEFLLPEGCYEVYFSSDGIVVGPSAPILVSYDSLYQGFPSSYFTIVWDFEGSTFSFPSVLVDSFDLSGATWLSIQLQGAVIPEGAIFKFVPVDDEIVSLTDLISSVRIDSILNEIICLLPVAVGCVVLFLGIRKGIAFLFNFLNGA